MTDKAVTRKAKVAKIKQAMIATSLERGDGPKLSVFISEMMFILHDEDVDYLYQEALAGRAEL